MAWCRPGDKPLSEPMTVRLLTYTLHSAISLLRVFAVLRWHWTWWRHQMETFSSLRALCEGNSPVTDESPSQRAVNRSFDVSFYLCLNKRLSKQSRRRWFERPSRQLWRPCNEQLNSGASEMIPKDAFKLRRYQTPTKYDEAPTYLSLYLRITITLEL